MKDELAVTSCFIAGLHRMHDMILQLSLWFKQIILWIFKMYPVLVVLFYMTVFLCLHSEHSFSYKLHVREGGFGSRRGFFYSPLCLWNVGLLWTVLNTLDPDSKVNVPLASRVPVPFPFAQEFQACFACPLCPVGTCLVPPQVNQPFSCLLNSSKNWSVVQD